METPPDRQPRLPASPGTWIFRDPFAGLWLRPWFDWTALRLITKWYLPLSRAWAAALVAGDNVERFWTELPATRTGNARLLAKALGIVAQRRRLHEAADRHWHRAFFGSAEMDVETRVQAEKRRRATAEMLMLSRGAFVPLATRTALPPVKFDIPTPEEMSRRHRHRLQTPESAFPVPAEVDIAQSLTVPGATGEQYWLRFPAPASEGDDMVWARVFEPEFAADAPTMIFLHGITMEMEFWPDSRDPIPALTGQGIRVVRVEGPWHGRRRPDGFYGGEPALARAPVGMIDLFEAWVAEVGALIRWSRQISRGPVVVAGISLGALTSQLVATAASHWPEAMRPDALFLVSTSGDVGATVTDSSLAHGIGLPERMTARGWNAATLEPWLPLAEPRGNLALAPEHVVMVLGRGDDVTPFAGGQALAERWQVPDSNRFIWQRGHFSAGLGIVADEGPIARLVEILAAIAPRR